MAKTHGLAGTYRHGCRCDACRVANTERWRQQQEERSQRPFEEIPHGFSGYANWRCRCDVCKAAGSVKNAQWRQARREQQDGGDRHVGA